MRAPRKLKSSSLLGVDWCKRRFQAARPLEYDDSPQRHVSTSRVCSYLSPFPWIVPNPILLPPVSRLPARYPRPRTRVPRGDIPACVRCWTSRNALGCRGRSTFSYVLARCFECHGRLYTKQSKVTRGFSVVHDRMRGILYPLACLSIWLHYTQVFFVPRTVSGAAFSSLLASADVVLHPFPFGGSKTSADALAVGVSLSSQSRKMVARGVQQDDVEGT